MKNEQKALLARAQSEYGFANQVTVASEELNELAAVLAKYPRFPTHEIASDEIREKVVEEIADVVVGLEHLVMIFDIDYDEIEEVIKSKLERLERWLNSGKGMYQTTKDRKW